MNIGNNSNIQDLSKLQAYTNQNSGETFEGDSFKKDLLAQLDTIVSGYDRNAFATVQAKEDEEKAWEDLLEFVDQQVAENGEHIAKETLEKLEDRLEQDQLTRELLFPVDEENLDLKDVL